MGDATGYDGGAQALAEQEKRDLRAAVAESLTPLRASAGGVDMGGFASPIDVDSARDDRSDAGQAALRQIEEQEREDLRKAIEESPREAGRHGIANGASGAPANLQAKAELPAGWEAHVSRSTGKTFYVNRCSSADTLRTRALECQSLRAPKDGA